MDRLTVARKLALGHDVPSSARTSHGNRAYDATAVAHGCTWLHLTAFAQSSFIQAPAMTGGRFFWWGGFFLWGFPISALKRLPLLRGVVIIAHARLDNSSQFPSRVSAILEARKRPGPLSDVAIEGGLLDLQYLQ